jgi:hypothetical protein
MFDLVQLWKKVVFAKLEEQEVADITANTGGQALRHIALVRAADPFVPAPGEGAVSSDSDDGNIRLHRRSSPVNRMWRIAQM